MSSFDISLPKVVVCDVKYGPIRLYMGGTFTKELTEKSYQPSTRLIFSLGALQLRQLGYSPFRPWQIASNNKCLTGLNKVLHFPKVDTLPIRQTGESVLASTMPWPFLISKYLLTNYNVFVWVYCMMLSYLLICHYYCQITSFEGG